MRKLFFLLLTGSTCLAHAQTPQPKLAGKPQPVGPNIRYYQPPDLQVTYLSLRSCTRNASRGAYQVTINVTVHNNGELPSNELTTLKTFYSLSLPGVIKPPTPLPPAANDPGHGSPGPWTPCAAEPKLPIVKGGQSWGGDLSFEVSYDDVHPNAKFYLVLLADFYNNSKESNESNNYSTPILITPPNH